MTEFFSVISKTCRSMAEKNQVAIMGHGTKKGWKPLVQTKGCQTHFYFRDQIRTRPISS